MLGWRYWITYAFPFLLWLLYWKLLVDERLNSSNTIVVMKTHIIHLWKWTLLPKMHITHLWNKTLEYIGDLPRKHFCKDACNWTLKHCCQLPTFKCNVVARCLWPTFEKRNIVTNMNNVSIMCSWIHIWKITTLQKWIVNPSPFLESKLNTVYGLMKKLFIIMSISSKSFFQHTNNK